MNDTGFLPYANLNLSAIFAKNDMILDKNRLI